ncbi:MAG TPA: hypothetical protein PKY59_03190 [Pyrinomonadaceae bacterium]|nr:hypothetical protein [Pyrinomonadaceae bacterium]
MKVCPKCNSSYSDETLNFCLSDGSPLVADGTSTSEFSQSWHDSETLHDNRLHDSENTHSTNPNAPHKTIFLTQAKTETFTRPTESSGKKFYAFIGGIIALLLIVGGIWWFYWDKNPKTGNVGTPENNSGSQTPRVIVQLTPEQDAKVKKEVTDFIETWRKTNEDREIDKHIELYANTLEYFYKESGINRNKVRASRQQAYETFPSLSLQVDKLKISPESETSAVAVFDKSWTFKNDKKTTTGRVQQELRVAKQNGKWQIVGEKDLNVYFINNLLNETANENANTSNTKKE